MALTKLTLSSDIDTIRLAKKLASENHISVSKLFKNLILEVSKKTAEEDLLFEKLKNTEIPDWIKRLSVVDKPTPDFDHKAEYRKHIEQKYGQ